MQYGNAYATFKSNFLQYWWLYTFTAAATPVQESNVYGFLYRR